MNRLERIVRDAANDGLDLDLHLHTFHSIDVIGGNTFDEFIEQAARLGIVPGFLDHFQGEKLSWDGYPFTADGLTTYLEDYEQARESGYPSWIGLEVDFYDPETHDEWNRDAMDVLDGFRDDFNYLVATIHDVDKYTVTIPFEFKNLLDTMEFDKAREDYYRTARAAIETRYFDGLAHPDVIYRFCGDGDQGIIPNREQYRNDPRTFELLELCSRAGLVIEINVRGFDHPWATTYPSRNLLETFMSENAGAAFFVGSDSHDVSTFARLAPVTREFNQFFRENYHAKT